jgi:hypothetical protein
MASRKQFFKQGAMLVAGLEGFFREVGVPVGQPYVQKPQAERRAAAARYGFVQKEQN